VRKVRINGYQDLPLIREQTENYLSREDVKSKIGEIAKLLKSTSGLTPYHDCNHDAESLARIKRINRNAARLEHAPESEYNEMQEVIFLLACTARGDFDLVEADSSEADSSEVNSREADSGAMASPESPDRLYYSSENLTSSKARGFSSPQMRGKRRGQRGLSRRESSGMS